MQQYHIFHSTSNLRFTEIKTQQREYVGYVEADSLEEAFKLSQNFDKPWNPINPCRSTSVGDVIQSDEGFFMVCGRGFEELTEETSKNDSELNSFESTLGQAE